MMLMPKINCVHLDWGAGGKCNKLPKRFFNMFRQTCTEMRNLSPKNCTLHKKHIRPSGPPVSPPCRVYKCYGSNMVRTKESKQADYEWNCKLIERKTK